jgi:uncharacterized protein (DUF305 family)
MKKYLIGISTAAIMAVATGCGGGGGAGSNMDQEPTTASSQAAPAEHNDQDVTFAQGMIPHHQQAIDMATAAAGKATNPKVKELATQVQGAQDPELQQLTGMLEKWGAPTAPAESTGSGMPGMDHGDMSSGSGMMTEEQMGQLEQATGAEFDRMWLQMMIEHHQGAVAMARTEVEQGSDPDAKALARTIVATQEAEITEMQGMLA